VSLDDGACYRQTQACIAWAAFASGWIGSIEPVEDLANVLRIDGYPLLRTDSVTLSGVCSICTDISLPSGV
jgi:hypothetical protein